MKAAFLTKPKQKEQKQIDLPEPKEGEVRVKLKMIGVCGSDVHLFLGHRLLDNPNIIACGFAGDIIQHTYNANKFSSYNRNDVDIFFS